ncbi:HAD family hydrolase [Actinomycetota bacterium]
MSEQPRTAVLFDFGGVLTHSMHEAFERLALSLGLDPDLPLRLLSHDPQARQALVDHECGRLDDNGFEEAYAVVLREHGADVSADGLLARLAAGLQPEPVMIDLVREVRDAGHPVALVSNSLGRDCYAGVDLDSLFDVQVISGQIGVRKPSRRIFEVACERLGVPTEGTVLVDDVQVNLDGAARLGIRGILHRSPAQTATELREALALVPEETA